MSLSSHAVPLLSDQDNEAEQNLPSYEEVVNDQQKSSIDQNSASNKFRIDVRGGVDHFWSDLGKGRANGEGGGMIDGILSKHLQNIDQNNSVAMAQLHIRLAFLRKVLGILAFQFLATIGLGVAFYITDGVKVFIQQQPWFPFASFFGSIVLLFAMFVYARSVPLNYFLLGGWTILQAVTVGTIVSFYDLGVVLQSLVLTAVVVVSLFIYTLQSKRDFHKYYATLFSVSLLFLAATMVQMLVMSSALNFVMSLFGAVLFSVYLVFDIDDIMNHYSEEDYIIACLSIYLDIINLFLRILQILNEINRN
ncbi:hypothetical protein niasHS_013569 [Heterodera schachtii]|uniref:Uncharacterized protein n=1 Tax=Heterodera schachtii TaxID=97005 RepID=A0ABD2IJB9_HETSC